MAKYLSSAAFAKAAKDGTLTDDACVVKEFTTEAVADDVARTVKFTITTGDVDRENDVVNPRGWDLSGYMKSPVVLWAHDYRSLPIAKALDITMIQNGLTSTAQFPQKGTYPFADTVFELIKGGFIKAASVGFKPIEWTYDEERRGVNHIKQSLLEWSCVPVPANPFALVAASAQGIDTSVVKAWAEETLAALRASEGQKSDQRIQRIAEVRDVVAASLVNGPSRWNPQLSKSFDVTEQEYPPRSAEQALAAKYCACEIRSLYYREESVQSVRMGAFLSALDEQLAKAQIDDTRNLSYQGTEEPPLYQVLQLTSSKTGEFLVDGMRFLRYQDAKLTLRLTPRWFGLDVTLYAARQYKTVAQTFLGAVYTRAAQLNFLKGEAFSLSGEFLARGDESFADLFLAEKNQKAMQRVLTLLTEKGAAMENRGQLLLGPPGNGKTLVGRILMNKAPATFVWVSSRDFHYAGSFGGVASAFDIARECAPSILFIEDIDNWLTSTTVDLLKTEMDGIAQSKGVVTILTTNYPELLPKALIDRPGRFHDVLRFDLPDESQRRRMLAKWLPDLTGKMLEQVVAELRSYSGAHVREFARFVGIIREQEHLDVPTAASQALEKLAEQRDLITQVQTSGSRYRAPEFVRTKTMTAIMKERAAMASEVLDKTPHVIDATESADEIVDKGVSPKDVSTVKAPEDQAWKGPTLGDFTDQGWAELSDAEKRKIAGHAAWAAKMPPDTFGDIKLWHHDPKSGGKVVWRGVVAATGRLNQADIPSADDGAVKAHLRRHFKAFRPDDAVPDAIQASLAPPFDRDEIGWKAFTKARDRAQRKAGVEPLTDLQIADLFEDYGFDLEASVLRGVTKQDDETGEEAAELVQYQALETMLGQLAALVAAAQKLVTALVTDETESPTETPEGETAEEALEEARLSAVLALCQQMCGSIMGVQQLAEALLEDEDDEDLMPVVVEPSMEMAETDAVTKRGRVLSKINENKVKAARTHTHQARSLMDQVLASIRATPVADDEKAVPGDVLTISDVLDDDAGEAIVWRFADEPSRDDVLEIDAEDLSGALQDAVRGAMAEVVRRETQAAINALRGRID